MKRQMIRLLLVAATSVFLFPHSEKSVLKAEELNLPADAVLYADAEFRGIIKQLYDALVPVEIADAQLREQLGIGLTEIQRIRIVVTPPGPSGAPVIGGVVDLAGELNLKEKFAGGQFKVEEIAGPDNKPMLMLMIVQSPPLFLRQTGPKQVFVGITPQSLVQLSTAPGTTGTGRINEMVAEIQPGGLVNVIAAVEPVRPMLTQVFAANANRIQGSLPPQFHEVMEIPKWLDGITIRSAVANKELETKVSLRMVDDASAIKMHNLMEKGLEYGFQMIQQSTKQGNASPAVQASVARYMTRLEKGLNTMLPEVNGKEMNTTIRGVNTVASTGVLVGLLLPAVQAARQAAQRMSGANNLKQIGLALHNYHATYDRLPPRYSVDAQGKPLLSWRVLILPFIEQQDLYAKFHLDEPWNSPHNAALISEMPSVYVMPGATNNGKTNYLAFDLDGGPWEDAKQLGFRDFFDGTSNTVIVAEANQGAQVFWSNPNDLAFDNADPLKGLTNARPGGFHVLFTDGAVRFLTNNIDVSLLKAIVTRNGSETIQLP